MIVLKQTPKNLLDRIGKKVYREIQNFYRQYLRKKIALTRPCPSYEADLDFSVHMLICKKDLLMGICSAKSFNLASNLFFHYIFHDDGTLSEDDYKLLTYHFPLCQIISYQSSLKAASTVFNDYPLIYEYRLKGVMMLKLVDIKLFDNNEKAILLDSDILFFHNPEYIVKLARDKQSANAFNKDIETAYMIPKEELDKLVNKKVPEKLNAGLSVINCNVINFDLIENWLATLKLNESKIILHRIEQSLMALLVTIDKKGFMHLPSGYDVAFSKDIAQSICKHYVGAIRHGFELEGIRYLIKNHFIKRWNGFVSQ